MTSVLLADDQDSVRLAFRMILDAQPDLTVVAEATDGDRAIELARRLRPDVVLTDIRMPGQDGLEVTRALAGAHVADPLRVVVVTTFGHDEYVYGALRAGACGFLVKRSSPALLVESVRAAAAGDALLSPEITVRLLQTLGAGGPSRARVAADVPLTPRERDVARQVAGGATNAEIAGSLYLSVGTVKNHVSAIEAKLGVRNRVGVAVWAWEHDLASDPTP